MRDDVVALTVGERPRGLIPLSELFCLPLSELLCLPLSGLLRERPDVGESTVLAEDRLFGLEA